MTDAEKEYQAKCEAAAEEHANSEGDNGNALLSFKAGIAWCRANPAPEVEWLAHAAHLLRLESQSFLSMANPHDHGHTNMKVLADWIKETEDALSAYKKARGGEK